MVTIKWRIHIHNDHISPIVFGVAIFIILLNNINTLSGYAQYVGGIHIFRIR